MPIDECLIDVFVANLVRWRNPGDVFPLSTTVPTKLVAPPAIQGADQSAPARATG